MSNTGNRAFMLSVGVGAGGVVAFGLTTLSLAILSKLTTLSLAILFVAMLVSVGVGIALEKHFDAEEEKRNLAEEKEREMDLQLAERVTREVKKQAGKKTAKHRPFPKGFKQTVRYGSRSWTFDDEALLIEFLILHGLIMDEAEYFAMDELELGATLSIYEGPEPLPVIDEVGSADVHAGAASEVAPAAYDSSLPALDTPSEPNYGSEPEPVVVDDDPTRQNYDYSGGYDSGSDLGSSFDSDDW